MDLIEWQKRVSVVITVAGLSVLSIGGRLYQKAFLEHKELVAEAESQYAYRKDIVGQRGEIVVADEASTYFPLATNERRYQVLVIPNHITNPKDIAAKLSPHVEMSEADILARVDTDKLYIPPLKRRLSRQQADAIAELRLRGVVLMPEYVRSYPEQGLAAQLLGFVNVDGEGKYGLEGAYDSLLKGISGYQYGEKDSHKRLITVTQEVESRDGAQVVLSLDREIQFQVERILKASVERYEADSGSVVIINPKTGAIVSMASWPTYNPNEYNKVPSDQQHLFLNPTVSSVWEPGSIIKPLVMALAIDKGLVEPDTKETFEASVRVLGHTIWTAEKKAFGEQTMTQVLENSDNVGMVWIADKLGNQAEYDGLVKFGFGTEPEIKLGSVVGGVLPRLKSWNDLTRATVSFGQGMSATPLQVAMAYGALANSGVMMQPYLVSEVVGEDGVLAKHEPKEIGRVVSSETSKKLGLMLESVVINGHGKRAGVQGYRVGGKTGTAQVPDPKGGYYEDRHIGSFSGYFPISDPQYAMVVKLDNPKNVEFAESSAAPTFGEIAGWILRQKQIRPDKQ